MRTLTTSKNIIYYVGLFFLSLFFILGIFFMPKTFASDENEEEASYTLIKNEHFVTIYDGNTKKTIQTEAKTVEEVIDRLNIVVSSSDKISPAPETEITENNFYINIYRSHPILIIDDAVSKIAEVSSFDPLTAVRSAGFVVYDNDKIEIVSTNNFLESGVSSAYKIIRGDGNITTEEEDLLYETTTIKDYDIPSGSEEVRQIGELGKVRKTYRIKTLNNEIVEKELVSEEIIRQPVNKIIAIGATKISSSPLTVSMGRNRYTTTNLSGQTVERQETYYDLPMSGVMGFCGKTSYSVREDGVKIDDEGYVIIAAELSRYPRCSVVETSLGKGKVYDTGGFAATNPEQFDLATDWTNHDGR